MSGCVIGLDIGGANTKAALVDRDGAVRVASEPFAVWRDPGGLAAVIARVVGALGAPGVPVALTTTAELCDVFASKREGMGFVLDAAAAALGDRRSTVMRIDGSLVSLAAAVSDPLPCAAANWMASALLVAGALPDAILADCGSTTTDLIPIAGGRVVASGRTDVERLLCGELVYTGALRTNLATIVSAVPVGGRPCPVAAEQFAVSADVHLLLGRLTPDQCADLDGFPDGRGAGVAAVRARLARLVCADPEQLAPGDLEAIARTVADAQVAQIADALTRVRARVADSAPVVAVGVGAFLVEDAARVLGARLHELSVGEGPLAALAGEGGAIAPAAALSMLGRD